MGSAKPARISFAGRVGGNQEFVLQRDNAEDAAILEKIPDAAPLVPFRDLFDLGGFVEIELWKAAVVEGFGTFVLVWLTVWISVGQFKIVQPSPTSGIYATTTFLAPLVGGITNMFILSLCTYGFGPVSGAHLNPTISFAAFFARLMSFPRLVLYVVFQLLGASLAGLLVRAGYDSRNFTCGGCGVITSLVSVGDAFSIEFSSDLALIFLSFGVGLDPRQKAAYGPGLAPILVGAVLGVISFGTAIVRQGYNGASLNPARCFGTFVGGHFPVYHWIHWVAPISAALVHGTLYYLIPPWNYGGSFSKAEMYTIQEGSANREYVKPVRSTS
ncbi:aquaporin-like protein [Aspergillus floccosus]